MRDFSNERLARQGVRVINEDGDLTARAAAFTDEDEVAFADQIAARWNACADALGMLERETALGSREVTEARRLLRLAVHGGNA